MVEVNMAAIDAFADGLTGLPGSAAGKLR